MPKFGHFGSKSINFLILTKFCMYPISKVLTSNPTFVFKNFEHKSPNLGITNFKTNFKKNSHIPYFDGANFKSDVGF